MKEEKQTLIREKKALEDQKETLIREKQALEEEIAKIEQTLTKETARL